MGVTPLREARASGISDCFVHPGKCVDCWLDPVTCAKAPPPATPPPSSCDPQYAQGCTNDGGSLNNYCICVMPNGQTNSGCGAAAASSCAKYGGEMQSTGSQCQCVGVKGPLGPDGQPYCPPPSTKTCGGCTAPCPSGTTYSCSYGPGSCVANTPCPSGAFPGNIGNATCVCPNGGGAHSDPWRGGMTCDTVLPACGIL